MGRMIRVKPEEHAHRVATTSGPLPFFGPVAERGGGQNPRAWGNIRVRQRCSCGAVRELLINGDFDESGPWIPAVREGGTRVPIRPERREAS